MNIGTSDDLQPSPLAEETSSPQPHPQDQKHGSFWPLFIGCIGVVYGDIGTSPLYAFREAMMAAGAAHNGVQRADVIGILSLILWSLMIIVTLKYVVILLRADNDGEGGTLSLMSVACVILLMIWLFSMRSIPFTPCAFSRKMARLA